MPAFVVTEIENRLAQLTPAVPLRVPERLVHQKRESLAPGRDQWQRGLSVTAAASEMQRELGRISSKFSVAEAGGLERTR